MLTDQSRTKLHYIIHYLQPADPHCFNKLRSLRLARAPSSSSNVLRSLYTVLWESMMISHVISRNCYVSSRPCPTPPDRALCIMPEWLACKLEWLGARPPSALPPGAYYIYISAKLQNCAYRARIDKHKLMHWSYRKCEKELELRLELWHDGIVL